MSTDSASFENLCGISSNPIMKSNYTFSNHICCICRNMHKLHDRINELEAQLDISKNQDEIFLLSIEEYKKYSNIIPEINTFWWLRSPGNSAYEAAFVYCDGTIMDDGNRVTFNNAAIRPALRLSNQEYKNLKLGDIFIKYKFPWIKMSEDIAIAETPIAFRRFDEKSNDYENSEIRQFLLNWIKERK